MLLDLFFKGLGAVKALGVFFEKAYTFQERTSMARRNMCMHAQTAYAYRDARLSSQALHTSSLATLETPKHPFPIVTCSTLLFCNASAS